MKPKYPIPNPSQQQPPAKKHKQNVGIPQELSTSIVKISCHKFSPDYGSPWKHGEEHETVASGSVINKEKGWILTCAHAGDSRAILKVRLANGIKDYHATVLVSDPDADLAIIHVEDPEFRHAATQLELGNFQALNSRIKVLGFPVTGEELTANPGYISSNELRNYVWGDGVNLTSMVTAPINPGINGGPVLNEQDQLIGVAFQSLNPGAVEGAGFIIPIPVIQQFLKGVSKTLKTGINSVGVPDLPVTLQNMQNSTLRKVYNMKPEHSGLRVCQIDPLAQVGELKINDIILSIDGHRIENDGKILSFPNICDRLDFLYLILQKQLGESIQLKVLRDGKELSFSVPLWHRAEELKLIGRKEFKYEPTYYIKNGLCFQPLTQNYGLSEQGILLQSVGDQTYGTIFDVPKTQPDQQLITISTVFDADITAGYETSQTIPVVNSINGFKIMNMRDVVHAMESNTKDFIHIELRARGKEITLGVATPEQEQKIAQRYHIQKTHSDDLTPLIQNTATTNPTAPLFGVKSTVANNSNHRDVSREKMGCK